MPIADVFDGADSAELGDHLEAFGLERVDLPPAVPLDADGADTLAAVVEAVSGLAIRLDEEAARWLTSPRDRGHGYGRVNLSALHSAGGLAAQVVRRAGVRPPLLKFKTPDDRALDRWIAAHRGGWLSAELAGAGLFPAVDIDVHSAYPAVAALLGWWELMIAAYLRRRDVLKMCWPFVKRRHEANSAGCSGPTRGITSALRSARSSRTVRAGPSSRPTTTIRKATPACGQSARPSPSRSRGPT